jgi:arylsulfatase A-like enzyme
MAPAKPLGEFDFVRAESADEWRDARRVGGNGIAAVRLGAVAQGAFLRFGYFDEDAERPRGSVRVYAGGHRIYFARLDGRGAWRDVRLDVLGAEGDELRLVVESPQPVWIASCEVVRPSAIEAPAPPNVLIFLIDTLRQDHVSVYGYPRKTARALEVLATDGAVLTQLMPSSSWTRPSVASLLTSLYPNYHGAQTIMDRLREGLPSLAGALAAQGYETQAIMGNANCVPTWGFGEDFARFVDISTRNEVNTPRDPLIADLAVEAIAHLRGRPWFLYVHAMGPHTPYDPPEPFKSEFATGLGDLTGNDRRLRSDIDRYDAEIAHTDYQFSRIVDALKSTGQYENTLIVVLSDHGEEFLDHGGWDHGHTLYEEMLRVPLIVKPPAGAWSVPGRVDALVEMVDVAPTILDAVGIEPPDGFQGRSFLSLLRGEPESPRAGYTSLTLHWHSLRAAKSGDHKYIRNVGDGTEAWYDLESDPRELAPMAAPDPPGKELQQLVTTKSFGGAAGLHVLVLAGARPQTAEISIEARGLTGVTADQFEWENRVSVEADRLLWTFTDRAFRPEPLDDNRPAQASHRVHARLHAHVPADAEIRMHAEFGGVPVDAAHVYLGRERRHAPLDSTAFSPADLLAHPDDFDLASLPEGSGVFIWYVAETDSLTDAEIPQKIRQELEALGYVQ